MNPDPIRLRSSSSARASITPDGLIILDIRGGELLASNVVGARIWALIEEQRTPPEIAQQIVADFDVPLERAQHDVEAFVAALVARGLVHESSAS